MHMEKYSAALTAKASAHQLLGAFQLCCDIETACNAIYSASQDIHVQQALTGHLALVLTICDQTHWRCVLFEPQERRVYGFRV